jgi:hypothetical protein
MRQVPFHDNPGNACALACYTMAAQYLFPELDITFEQLGKIANWHKGYAVWGFPVWKWLMDRGMKMVDYDVIDYQAWAEKGIDGLKSTLTEEEFNFYKNGTYDLEETRKDINLAFKHPNFTYIKKKLTWQDVVNEYKKPGICDLTLNSAILNKKSGFSGHRILIIDILDKEIVFHDPSKNGGPYRKESISFFRQAFEYLDGPELARYTR